MELQLQPKAVPAVDVHGGDLEKSYVTEVRNVDMAEANEGCCVTVLKRKRGRPAKGAPKVVPIVRQKKDEEDVCFICFDGGSLVLCDRRGCPKAYHPSCIKRDEAFFRSKAKWNCGWHICSICGKGSHYKCYTCTYSLCKGCTKRADFVSVRENKGLCGMCKRTIMLVENCAQGDKVLVCEVDFDDKSSWEYLFKVYWTYLKEKLSLTIDEILEAKNPCKGVVRLEVSGVAAGVSSLLLSPKMELPIGNIANDKLWHYQDPTGKVQGPFSLVQLYKWNVSGYFPADLRIWRIDETQDNAALLIHVLSGKCSKLVSLTYDSQKLSLETNSTLENKESSQDGGVEHNVITNGNSANHQIVDQCGEQKLVDTCTQSNGKDESVKSNGWHSQSPGWTIQADGNNNEGQSGNSERREDSPKCEDGPHLHPSLPSTAFCEKLEENPSGKLEEVHKMEVKSEDNGNFDLNRIFDGQSNSGQNYQKQSDSEDNSGQSSGQNWSCPSVTNPVCNLSTWLSIFGEPNDLDESVSDLLAEVEAMESLGGGGLESPTSIMKCGEELTDGSITDCLSFADGLSPMLDAAGKGDALSSSGDLHFPSQTTTPDEPTKQTDVCHQHQKIFGEHTSKSSEVESTFSKISWNPHIQFSWDPPNC
ncbi:zinc finger CCCH domain-containing protein 44 isoform X2 [Vigna umbellata]|uniref:zinc finger CCCH domain-containing protein 44 isoform X1 n=1 Tax=Vigna umbellata TaxID=87088 RepID=UPI001F5E9B3D|nr:zinc finger CCCH domain-containing protein 44 isoform X1 [Vigna umbellata]XP_047165562.1 zinc finger CCCH domain-containing protein 44 isoform X2 [Vigna umbellata]